MLRITCNSATKTFDHRDYGFFYPTDRFECLAIESRNFSTTSSKDHRGCIFVLYQRAALMDMEKENYDPDLRLEWVQDRPYFLP